MCETFFWKLKSDPCPSHPTSIYTFKKEWHVTLIKRWCNRLNKRAIKQCVTWFIFFHVRFMHVYMYMYIDWYWNWIDDYALVKKDSMQLWEKHMGGGWVFVVLSLIEM